MTYGTPTQLRIVVLGPPQIVRADGAALVLRSRKHLALLIYLAVEQRHSLSRDSLLALLWPEAGDAAARNNLRVALADLRRGLGDDAAQFLRASRHTVQFAPTSDHTLDVLAFRGLLDAARRHAHEALERCPACLARLEQAAELYGGDFLHGFSLPDSSAFEEWATIQREQIQQQALDALDTLTVAGELRGDYVAQCRYARRQIELEPWREPAHAQLMRGLWASGQRGAALEQYETCRRVLEAELGLEPSPELTALYQQLRAGESSEFSVLSAELPASDLRTQHSTLNTQHLHNLPTRVTSFIGRDAQLDGLREALGRARLITLTGAGGCGKTRLALEAAGATLPAYPDGVWLVELEALRDASLLPQTVALALGIPISAGEPAAALLGAALQPKLLLLVLNNCEHLARACRELAELLLRACPQLTILATSREILRVAGELVWPVPPLATPDASVTDLAQLSGYEAIRLFLERARAVSPGFALTARNAPVVAQICRQLDSLPLAIELAAARVRHLSVEAIAARLGDRFSLLSEGGSSEPRQQRLRVALDWSYNLLSEPERSCFRRLAVFAGGFTLHAAEEVLGEPGEPAPGQAGAIDLLAQLIDKSLVAAEQRPEGMRYRLLETMRAYARDQLLASGEAEAIGARHLAHFLRLAEQAEPQLVSGDQVAWLDQLAAEHANLRAAVDWATQRGGIVAALRLVTALRYFWRVRGYYAEGIALLRSLLAHPLAAERTGARARALNAAGYLEFVRGQPADARELLEAALALGRELGDRPAAAFALRYLSALANAQRRYDEARACGEESLAIYRALGATNDIAGSSMYLGDIALALGDDDRAEALYAESVAILRMRHNSIALPYPLRHLGYLALRRGQPGQAAALCEESARLNLAVSDQQGVAAGLVGLAASAAATRRPERAAQLLGHAEQLLEAMHMRLLPFDREQHARVRHTVAEQLGAAAFAAACAAGGALSTEQLLAQTGAEAIAELRAPHPSLPTTLTPLFGRQRELTELAALLAKPEVRLLTLVGLGGMGKTRLALALAEQLCAGAPEEVVFAALANVGDAAAVPAALAQALGRALPAEDAQAKLTSWLQDKKLLVLDNFEQLLDAALPGAGRATALLTSLLHAAPNLSVLVTSRERLNLLGEHIYPVEGLAYAPEQPSPGDDGAPAVHLFVASAQRRRPDFAADSANLPGIMRICRLVQGMPLGLELAAAWVDILSPAEIAGEIEQSVDFLTSEWRDLPERQRSMRAVFGWSWNHLGEPEQLAFRQLAIFRAGFTRQAAQAVAGASALMLNRLVQKSLLRVSASNNGESRFELHELLRQFAEDGLAALPEQARQVRRRHAAFFAALAEQAEPQLVGADQVAWLDRLELEHDNMRAALGWAACEDRLIGLRLAAALTEFWWPRGYLGEGRRWLGLLLSRPIAEQQDAPRDWLLATAKALASAGELAYGQGDHQQATVLLQQSLVHYRQLGDQRGQARALLDLSNLLADRDLQRAGALRAESLALFRATGNMLGIAWVLLESGRGEPELARRIALIEESLALARAGGFPRTIATAVGNLGKIARLRGELELAWQHFTEGLAIGRRLRDSWLCAWMLDELGMLATQQGDWRQARSLLEESMAIFRQSGHDGGVAMVAEHLAAIPSDQQLLAVALAEPNTRPLE